MTDAIQRTNTEKLYQDLGLESVETGGQIFGNVDLLPTDNDSVKKKYSKKVQTSLNSLKTTGNITLIYFM